MFYLALEKVQAFGLLQNVTGIATAKIYQCLLSFGLEYRFYVVAFESPTNYLCPWDG